MGLWTDIVGSVRGYIRLGLTGVRLKNSSGALAVRNAGDSADAALSCAGLTLSDKVTFADNTLLNSSPTGGFKNKIIGGDFTTNPWQRGTSFVAGAAEGYTADRWKTNWLNDGVITITKTADAPTAAQAGMFTQHCLHVDVTTADATIGATQFGCISQFVEGYNAACFGFGQSGTRYVTLSFWVKSTKTGIFCVAFSNAAETRAYVAEYTVNTTNTWERKTITIPVDTSGTWSYDSGTGLSVIFTLAAGTSRQTTGGSWQTISGTIVATSNQVNALDSTSNDFKIALVQLEAGSVATPFETRSAGQEMGLCEWYYTTRIVLEASSAGHNWVSGYGGGGHVNNYWSLPTMRAQPTLSLLNNSNVQYYSYGGSWTASTLTVGYVGDSRALSVIVWATADGDGRGKLLRCTNATPVTMVADAEL